MKELFELRCTRINSDRYRLGSTPSPMYVYGWQPHFSTLFHRKTQKSRMPVSIRYGVGRYGDRRWQRRGAV